MVEMTSTAAVSTCEFCGVESRNAHLCPQCGKVQPLDARTDYFEFFGLSKKLTLDATQLERAFYELSRQLHPDYFMTASPAEKLASTARASMLNDAYRTLSDPIARVQYLLSLEGFKENEKKAPPDLLEEVFELNMQIEELKGAKKSGDDDEANVARTALQRALVDLEKRLSRIDDEISREFPEWDAAVEAGNEAGAGRPALQRMSELLSHRSYIRNLVRDIGEEIG